MNTKKVWMYIAIGAILLSITSLLLPIISYSSEDSVEFEHYNIIRLVNNDEFVETVFGEYTGEFLRDVSDQDAAIYVLILCGIGVVAIVFAFVGIRSMTKQFESKTPFRLTICGLIGTAIPSVVLIIMYLISKDQYLGEMKLGAYIVITPIAMVIACMAVTSKYRMTVQEMKIYAEAKNYIRPAGDLPSQRQGGNQYYGQ